MALLTLSNIAQSYGAFDLFSGVSASIPKGGKAGLVGPNGIGKTTLLRIIAGFDDPSAGSTHTPRDTTIGYLHQDAVTAFSEKESTLYNELLAVFADVIALGDELQALEESLESADADTLERYGNLQMKFETDGGYDYEVRIRQVLQGLGFRPDQYDMSISMLSGGQKTRALLGRILLEKPNLLILDEPTNHLDVQAIEWLEGILKLWDGAVLIVSHDRYFLDRVVDTIWELSREGMESYKGNYSHYVRQRDERWLNRQNNFDAVHGRFLKELDYIKKNIARDSTKNMAVGRLKRLIREVKMVQVAGINSILNTKWSEARSEHEISGSKWEVPDVESAIKGLHRPSNRPSVMTLNLKPCGRSGNIVLRTHDLSVGYEPPALFSVDNIELMREECAALIGPNGTGKTTLLKTILDRLEPITGEIELGANLERAYFAQAHDELDRNRTVLDEFIEHTNMLIPHARNHLGRFLFRGEDVMKPIHLLSGGERGRLSLSILEWEKANFLLLDEPSNHLDLHAQEVLQSSLEQYKGTILMVSHDRFLINRIATQIWELRDGRMHIFKGNYQEYLENRAMEKKGEAVQKSVERKADRIEKKVLRSAEKAKPVISKNELRKKEKRLASVEKQIEALDETMKDASLTVQNASTSGDFDRIQLASEAFAQLEEKALKLMTEWEELAAELESYHS